MNINSTKRRSNWIWPLLIMVGVAMSCEDDDKPVVNSTPIIELADEMIESFPNTQFTISATLSDEAGLKNIQMENSEWLLNKTINLEGSPKSYELRYKFTVPADELINSEHTIKLVVSNIGDKNTEIVIPVKLSLDVTNPTLNIAKPSNDGSYIIKANDSEFKIELSLADDKQLAMLQIKSTALGLDESVTLSGTSDDYTTDVNFNTPGSYEIAFTLTDATGNSTTATRKIKLIEALQFEEMFLTDVFTVQELTSDLYGVPLLMTPSTVPAETGYVFSTRYYSSAVGTPIKFIPQEASFDPFVFGANSGVSGGVAIGNDAPVITLPAVGYYEIKLDLRDMTYTATAYTPSDGLQSTMFMAGRGYDGQNWDPSVATQLTRNPLNPYEFSFETEFYLESGGSPATVQWIFIHSRTWNLPYWRFDSSTPRKVIASIGSDMGGTNVSIVVPTPTTYKVTFDYHLNHSKAVKQ